jgi:hypothetical protein
MSDITKRLTIIISAIVVVICICRMASCTEHIFEIDPTYKRYQPELKEKLVGPKR